MKNQEKIKEEEKVEYNKTVLQKLENHDRRFAFLNLKAMENKEIDEDTILPTEKSGESDIFQYGLTKVRVFIIQFVSNDLSERILGS